MDSIEKLASLFERFPGIGPRQAGRFVHYLLRVSPAMRKEIADEINRLGSSVHQCNQCFRYFALPAVALAKEGGGKDNCALCENTRRDGSLLMIVARDADLDAIESSGTYNGRYFVLGGTLMLGKDKQTHLREKEVLSAAEGRAQKDLKEIILAFPANPEGDATAEYVRHALEPISEKHELKMTTLGRGLSTGSELEYADSETIKNAFDNRI